MSPLFVPGPVDVAPEVLAAQAKPMLPHRSKEFETIFHRAEGKVRKLFFTESRVFLGTHSGTGMQETGIRCLVQESVLSCINGAFSQRFYDVATLNGKQADKLEVTWGQAITPDLLADALKKKKYEAVTIVHNETSTGVMNPLKELAAVVHEVSPETLILVDAVSSFSGARIEVDAWGLDFVLSSSQKAMALPPGLSFAATADRALEKAEKVDNRGWYFDLLRLEKHRIKNSTPMTPVVPLIYALDVQTDRIFEEGIEKRFERHAAMAKRMMEWAGEQGMKPFADENHLSMTVSAIENSHGWDIGELNNFLIQRGMRIANGYGVLKGKTYRIAHMGEIQMEDIENLISAIEEFMGS